MLSLVQDNRWRRMQKTYLGGPQSRGPRINRLALVRCKVEIVPLPVELPSRPGLEMSNAAFAFSIQCGGADVLFALHRVLRSWYCQ
jgi:hypothetical protein